jgi:CubicO group peptidase (beta-lactamase class C family)
MTSPLQRKQQNSFRIWISGLLSLFLLLGTLTGCSPSTEETERYFPDEEWEKIADPEAAGWSEEKLDEAKAFTDTLATAAVVIVHDGKILRKWGNVEKKYKCHSIRKSFLSGLYGVHVGKGNIDLSATLADLGIDDNDPSLSDKEKQATVRMLLQARSGVYHPALYETDAMAAARPDRHSHEPGTFWYYNNWDFNTLATIFEQETGRKIFKEFDRAIAQPIGMQSFDSQTDGEYYEGDASIHPAYPFEMTAMDMARFGLLYERNGEWEGEQVIPESWIEESTTSYSDAGDSGGYGYLWWVADDGQHFSDLDEKVPEGLFTARGYRGHVIAVVPDMDLVLVHRVDTFTSDDRVSYSKVGELLMHIVDAYEAERE